jgi:Ca-activated chloride channel family protein
MHAILARSIAAILISTPVAAAAAPAEPKGPVRLNEVRGSALLFRTATPGAFLPVPMVGADVDVHIAGAAAGVTVRQQYYNPTDRWLEAVYLFPLGEDGAVYRTRIEAGGRVIEGRIAEREEARRSYDQAVRDGRRAGLIEQERPNIFTASVANIAPHEVVTVEIGYREALRYADGRYRFRFPMVVAPRYVPLPAQALTASERVGPSVSETVADARRISAPVLPPAMGRINPVKMHITLDAGFPLASIESAYHPVTISDGEGGRKLITLADGAVAADRDFELSWTPAPGAAPEASVFRETVDGDDYVMVLVMPPPVETDAAEKPRELTLVIDTSGSMFGPSIAQAKQASGLALDRLHPADTFNLIEFNSITHALFEAPRPAVGTNLAFGRRFLDGLRADGGTEMLPALRAALAGAMQSDRLRQVILVTDGAVGNEAALFGEIARGLGDRRLFTVGIGSAPNGYFMTRAAQAGGGTYVHVGKVEEVKARMGELLAKLERPAMTDIVAAWPAPAVDSLPARIPDLYSGDPIVLFVRIAGRLESAAALRLSGRIGDAPWSRSLDLGQAIAGDGISALWGRAKIAELMGTLRDGADPEQVRRAVLDLALRHHLMSRYTSLVAVDTEPARPAAAAMTTEYVPLNLPAGWSYEKIFGEMLPSRAAPAPQRDMMPTPQTAQPIALPQGATPMEVHLIVGLTAVALLIVVVAWRRRSA